MSSSSRVSIVMITYNRGTSIRTALEQLLALPGAPPIIVVDNGSKDGTVDAVRMLDERIQLVSLGQNLGCAGRNVGVERAPTPYVAFADDDSWWAPGALGRAADLFDADASLGLLAARILVGAHERLDPICHLMATGPLSRACRGRAGVPIVGFIACGAVVRRQAFLEAGGFERRFGVGGEEAVLALDLLRRGWRLEYVDEVVAHHHPSPIRDTARRRRCEARNAIWSAWLRRPAISALAATGRIAAASLKDEAYRAGMIEAIRGMSWVLRARNPIPASVERQVRVSSQRERIMDASEAH